MKHSCQQQPGTKENGNPVKDFRAKINTKIICTYVLFFLAAYIWTLPWPVTFPDVGLDPSWLVGIKMADLKNMQFGKDIVFTFGPLGFLYQFSLHQALVYINHFQWLISFTFMLITHFLFIFAFIQLLVKLQLKWYYHVFMLLVISLLIPFISLDNKLLFFVIINLYLLSIGKINIKFVYPINFICAFFLAVASLIKFNAAIASISVLLMFFVILSFNRKISLALSCFLSYFFFIFSLWVILGQNLTNFPMYLYNSFHISLGYNDAMVIYGPKWQVYIGIICIILELVLLLTALLNFKHFKNIKLLNFVLLSCGFFFLSFKHGFVRQDGHVYIFFATCTLLFIISLLIFSKINKKIDYNLTNILSFSLISLVILMFCIIYHGNPWLPKENIIKKIPSYKSSVSLISNNQYRNQMIENSKANIRNFYPLDKQVVQYIGDKTMDIFPWDISLVYGYNFDWLPRPVIQSYSAYTTHLDNINAQHFQKILAPQVILYAYKSIDHRYPIFDEPATFVSVLQNYSFYKNTGEFVLLSRKEKAFPQQKVFLGSAETRLGEPVKVPDYNSGYVFAKIELEYNPWGKLIKLIYKPVLANVIFKFSDSTYSESFRLIPNVIKNGVFISQYIHDTNDLALIFSNKVKSNSSIKEMIIYVDNQKCYNKNIKIKFYAVPLKINQVGTSHETLDIPKWHLIEKVSGGIISIDTINNRLYGGEGQQIKIDKKKEKYITFRGWAADDRAKDGNVKTYLVFSSDEEEIVVPTRKNLRPDVAKYFNVESYQHSGWSVTISPGDFKEKRYKLSIRILRANGKEYYEIYGGKEICFE